MPQWTQNVESWPACLFSSVPPDSLSLALTPRSWTLGWTLRTLTLKSACPQANGTRRTQTSLHKKTLWGSNVGLSQKGKTGKEILTHGLESGEVAKETFPHFLSAAKFSQWNSPVARQETDNVSRLLTKQAKAIKTLLSLFYNMQSLTVCYSLRISPCVVSVYPLVCLVFVVCYCAHSACFCVKMSES